MKKKTFGRERAIDVKDALPCRSHTHGVPEQIEVSTYKVQ